MKTEEEIKAYLEGIHDGVDAFVKYLNSNAFPLRHDMERVEAYAEEFKKGYPIDF